MQRRLDELHTRLQSLTNNVWCQRLSQEISRLSLPLTNLSPIYRTDFTRDQLVSSVKTIHNLNLNIQSNELYRRALSNYLLFIGIHTNKLICEEFLRLVYRLQTDLIYWKEDERRQKQWPIIEQVRTVFFFDFDRDDIRTTEKIKYLKRHEDIFFTLIGQLALNINHLQEQQEQIDLDLLMRTTNELSKIFFEQTSMDYNAQSDLVDVLEFYDQFLTSYDDLKIQWLEKMKNYSRPKHLIRYLPHYICSIAVGIYIFYRVYTNRGRITDWISSTYDSLKIFIDEHLIVPLKTIYTSTFESRASQVSFENSQLNYANSKKILEEMLADYGRQHAQTLAKLNNVSVDEFLKALTERATNEDMNIVMKYYQQELDHPIQSALMGDLIKGILIQVQKVKVDGEGLVIQIDQLMKQNQINFSLLATIPSILLLTFVVLSTKNLVSNRVLKRRRYDLSTVREQILRKLRQIEHLLILNGDETTPWSIDDDRCFVIERIHRPDHSMNPRRFGHFLSLIYELKFYADQLKSRRMLSKEFNGDIDLLTYSQLSIEQKLRLINQIFHSYSFLVHVT